MTLLEPNSKKASFLLYLVGTFQFADVTVVGQTLRQFAQQSHRHFDCGLIRALSLIGIGGDLAGILSPNGMVLAYRSALARQSEIPLELKSQKEWSYELPFGYGPRVLALLEFIKPDVPRGTRSH
jgi:16S rRNA G527 N7-methylase RsmG